MRSPRAHLHVVGMLRFMSLRLTDTNQPVVWFNARSSHEVQTNRACPLLFILFLCLFLSLWPFQLYFIPKILPTLPRWGAAGAEIKVPSVESTELKHLPFKARSRSLYSHTCYAYCKGFLPYLILPFQSIHLHFFQNLSRSFSCVGCG